MRRISHRVIGDGGPGRSPYQDGSRIARSVVKEAETQPFSWHRESVLALS